MLDPRGERYHVDRAELPLTTQLARVLREARPADGAYLDELLTEAAGAPADPERVSRIVRDLGWAYQQRLIEEVGAAEVARAGLLRTSVDRRVPMTLDDLVAGELAAIQAEERGWELRDRDWLVQMQVTSGLMLLVAVGALNANATVEAPGMAPLLILGALLAVASFAAVVWSSLQQTLRHQPPGRSGVDMQLAVACHWALLGACMCLGIGIVGLGTS